MADFNKYSDTLLRWEGGFVDHPNDRGRATNKGVTIANWMRYGYDKNGDGVIDVEDLKLLSDADALKIFKEQYWDKMWGDKIHSQEMANIMFDFAVNSGLTRSVRTIQHLLNDMFGRGLVEDGIMGNNTLGAINSLSKNDTAKFHNRFIEYRTNYYLFLANELPTDSIDYGYIYGTGLRPSDSQKVFLNGWLNRIGDFDLLPIVGIGVGAVLLIGAITLFFSQGEIVNSLMI